MSENGEIYTAGKNFTLPPAVTAVTNSTSVQFVSLLWANFNLTFMDHVCWAYKLKAPVKWDMHQFDWLIKFPSAFEDVRKGKRGKWGNAIFSTDESALRSGQVVGKGSATYHSITLREC